VSGTAWGGVHTGLSFGSDVIMFILDIIIAFAIAIILFYVMLIILGIISMVAFAVAIPEIILRFMPQTYEYSTREKDRLNNYFNRYYADQKYEQSIEDYFERYWQEFI
jgi:hypothetical protein